MWEDERIEVIDGSSPASITVNGSTMPVEVGSNFVETVKSAALNAELGKFNLFLNGNKISPADAPDSISEGDRLEVRPYDVAGSVVA